MCSRRARSSVAGSVPRMARPVRSLASSRSRVAPAETEDAGGGPEAEPEGGAEGERSRTDEVSFVLGMGGRLFAALMVFPSERFSLLNTYDADFVPFCSTV